MNNDNKSSFFSWKLVFTIAIFIIGGLMMRNKNHEVKIKHDAIGKILIDGPIMNEAKIVNKLEELDKNSKLHALIIEVDSPGGAVVPSFRIYEAIKKISDDKKPIVIVMKSVAASGGYLISLAGDYIIAHPTTITGSVGVISMQPDFSELMNKIGVKPLIFKTGKLKASPNPGEPINEDIKNMMATVMEGTKKQFLDLVVTRRNLKDEKIIADIANSGIYLGVDAKQIGLIDETGGVEEAISWLKSKKIDFPVQEIEIHEEDNSNLLKKLLHTELNSNLMQALDKVAGQISMQGIYLLYN
jgi:protease-4